MKTIRMRDLVSEDGPIRKGFEDAAYAQYFMTYAATSMAEGGIWAKKIEPMVDKEEFFKRKEDGCYVSDSVDAAWWGWYAHATGARGD